jgi:hypothetical protein
VRPEGRRFARRRLTTCGRFHAHGDLRPEVARSVDSLKSRYLHVRPEPPPQAVDFREHYRRIFSADGLPGASTDDLKYFANANTGGNPGNMSVFNTAWNEMGADTAAERVRETIGYLLHGPDAVALEDRLTQLIDGRGNVGMPGFKEALLTKALCMVEPTRFLPINKYDGQAGKRQIAKWVFDLDLPAPESVSWTIGRLIVWSNDLLLALVGDGFVDADHIAGFLWWAKDAAGQEP